MGKTDIKAIGLVILLAVILTSILVAVGEDARQSRLVDTNSSLHDSTNTFVVSNVTNKFFGRTSPTLDSYCFSPSFYNGTNALNVTANVTRAGGSNSCFATSEASFNGETLEVNYSGITKTQEVRAGETILDRMFRVGQYVLILVLVLYLFSYYGVGSGLIK